MNDTNERYENLTKKLTDLAKGSPAIRAIFIVGSKTRDSSYNDRWSDIDYIIFTRNKESFLDNEDWMRKLGNPLTRIKQLTAGNDIEWSVSFDDGLDADFVFTSNKVTPFLIRTILSIAHATGWSLFRNLLFQLNMGASLYRSGYRCVYDLDDVEATIRELLKIKQPKATFAPETLESRNTCFWHYLERAVRKYRRGEYYVVRSRIHGLVHDYVYPLIELRESRAHPEKNIWYDGKLMETWIDPETNGRLSGLYRMETGEEIKRSIIGMIELYQDLFESVYGQYDFTFSYGDSMKLKSMILANLREAN